MTPTTTPSHPQGRNHDNKGATSGKRTKNGTSKVSAKDGHSAVGRPEQQQGSSKGRGQSSKGRSQSRKGRVRLARTELGVLMEGTQRRKIW